MVSHGEHNPRENPSASPLAACVRLILGRQLSNREVEAREIGAAEGVPALGLDGLSSTAYGPEAALTVLTAAGAAGLAYLGPVMLVILALLGILFISYWQTVEAYPKSGGAYTVWTAGFFADCFRRHYRSFNPAICNRSVHDIHVIADGYGRALAQGAA